MPRDTEFSNMNNRASAIFSTNQSQQLQMAVAEEETKKPRKLLQHQGSVESSGAHSPAFLAAY